MSALDITFKNKNIRQYIKEKMTNENIHVIEIRGNSKDCDKDHIAPVETPEKKYITSTGEVSTKILPTGASVEIHIEAEGKTTEEAKSRFREITHKIIKTIGDKTQFSFSSPETRKIEMTEKGYWNSQKITVTSIGKVHLSSENLGTVLSGLLENDISFSPPEFTFDEKTPIDLSIYEEATSRAKNKAKTIVAAAGCALGKVYDIKYSDGSEQETGLLWKGLETFSAENRDEDFFYSNISNSMMLDSLDHLQKSVRNAFKTEEKEEVTWDSRLLDLLETQIPNKVLKVSVSIKFEMEV